MEVRFKLNGKQVSAEVIRRYHTSGCIEKFRMLQCEMWVRDNKLRTLYSLDQWKIQTFLLDSGSRDRGAGSDDSGRAERGSRRVRCISCTGRCRTVWICSPGFIMNVLAMVRE